MLRLKTLGLTLDEMKELAEMYNQIMPRLLEFLDTHLNSIKDKIATLQRLEREIAEFRQRIANQYQLVK